MSKGKDHAKTTAVLAGISMAVCYKFDLTQWHTVGIFSGLLLTPDLDVDKGCIANHIIRSTPVVGEPLEWLWSRYWMPYSAFAKHRGILSHSIIVSSIVRLCYAFWWMALIPGTRFYYSFAVGLMISDAAHILMDMWSEFVDGFRLYKNSRKKG